MSRKAALFILALVPIWAAAPLSAQTITAEEAEDNYRRTFSITEADTNCEDDEGAIVVCARRDNDRHRLPLPVEPTPGVRLKGDVPNASAERGGAGTERCTTVGANQQCSGGLPVIPIVAKTVEAVVKLIEGDD